MRFKRLFRCLTVLVPVLAAVSCREAAPVGTWDDSVKGYVTISGKVTDSFGTPLVDVDIYFQGTDTRRELRKVTFSDFDGTFRIDRVPSNARFISFRKEGYATVAYTLRPEQFLSGEAIELNPVMEFSQAVIRGRVVDASTGGPFAGVQVDCGIASTVTLEDGSFVLEGLAIRGYTVKYITEGLSYTRELSMYDFIDGEASLPLVRLGGDDIFPGMKLQDLADAPVWYGNNYRGADGYSDINHWSVGYMSAFPVWLKAPDPAIEDDCFAHYRYEAEGCALVCMEGKNASYPADRLLGFTYGRKRIEAGNRYMNVNVRTHYASAAQPARFGVKVINLSDGGTVVEDAGEYSFASTAFQTFTFDLGKYVGKEVFIAFGIYFEPYNYHLPCRRIFFTSAPASGDDPLPGDPVEGAAWRGFTKENLSSLTTNDGRSFTGKNFGLDDTELEGGARRTHAPGGQQGFDLWRGTNHLAMSWTLQYVSQTAEPVNKEGFTIRTRSGNGADYTNPETYLYSRFHISDANDALHLYVRGFSSTNPTVFRVTAVPLDDFSAAALTPTANTAKTAAAVSGGNGCWQFLHEQGNGNPADYARFDYDLSAYSGRDVVLAIGVYKGATADGEQRLCIYGIEMD